jgi:hypothetical protein
MDKETCITLRELKKMMKVVVEANEKLEQRRKHLDSWEVALKEFEKRLKYKDLQLKKQQTCEGLVGH